MREGRGGERDAGAGKKEKAKHLTQRKRKPKGGNRDKLFKLFHTMYFIL